MDEARLYEDYTGVEAIGIDETSRRGHNYITVVADLVERNVINVTPGKDANTVKQFALDFMDHNGDPNRVRLVTCDMSLGTSSMSSSTPTRPSTRSGRPRAGRTAC